MNREIENEIKPSKAKELVKGKDSGHVNVKRWKEEEMGETNRYQISVGSSGTYYLEKQKASGWDIIDRDKNFQELDKRSGNRVYYHGTNHESAREILENRLKLNHTGDNFAQSKTYKKEVIHLTTTPERASHWAREDNITRVVERDGKYITQAPVVLKIDGSYINQQELQKDGKTMSDSDRVYSNNIPPEAISSWSIDPENNSEVRACADVYDRTGELNEFNKHDYPELVDEFERKCKMPF